MACSTASGTVVGPGMLRNSRPWRTDMGTFHRREYRTHSFPYRPGFVQPRP
jgi:hypothetical protein